MLEAQDAPPVVAGSANCLIVDDEPSVRRSLTRMLQAQGFNCFEAGSGQEGLQVLEENSQGIGQTLQVDAGPGQGVQAEDFEGPPADLQSRPGAECVAVGHDLK